MPSPASTFLLLASLLPLSLARTDLSGCTSYDLVINPRTAEAYQSVVWYVPGSGELCDFLDCGGGQAPPKTTVPGCPAYSGTATYSPSYINIASLTNSGEIVTVAGSQQATATGSGSGSGSGSKSGPITSAAETSATVLPTSTGAGAGSSDKIVSSIDGEGSSATTESFFAQTTGLTGSQPGSAAKVTTEAPASHTGTASQTEASSSLPTGTASQTTGSASQTAKATTSATKSAAAAGTRISGAGAAVVFVLFVAFACISMQ